MNLIPMKDDEEDQWELIFSSTAPYQAEIARSLLSENDIVSVIVNKQDSSYLTFGEIELYVKRSEILKAKQIINTLPESE